MSLSSEYWARLKDALRRTAISVDVDANAALLGGLPDMRRRQTWSRHVAELARDRDNPCRACHWFGVFMCIFLSLGVQTHHCDHQFDNTPSPWWVIFTAGFWFAYPAAILGAWLCDGFGAGLLAIGLIVPLALFRQAVASVTGRLL